jgi:hypothetical protein
MRAHICLRLSDMSNKNYCTFQKLSDIGSVNHKKIDTRLPADLHDLVSAYAEQNNLSRSQVVVAALKQFFGMCPTNPVAFAQSQGKASPQSPQAPAGVKTLRASESFDSTHSTATGKNSLPAG